MLKKMLPCNSIIVILVAAFSIALIEAQMPPKPELADRYRDQNLCPYLGVELDGTKYSYYTCNVPRKQKFCGVDTSFVYDCCPGFQRNKLFDGKCAEAQSVWRLMPDFMKTYGYGYISSILENDAFKALSNGTGSSVFTAFVPATEAGLKAAVDYSKFESSATSHPFFGSIARNRIYAKDLVDGAEFDGFIPGQKIKVTTYSNDLVFADCRAIVKPNVEVRNGLVHFVNKPILPQSYGTIKRNTVLDAVRNNPDTTEFAKDIPSDLQKLLSERFAGKWFTVFAPVNSAWTAIRQKYSNKIVQIVRNHIIKKMICQGAITSRSQNLGPTLANEKIGADCDSKYTQSILDRCGKAISFKQADLVAGNGVVHVINDVIVPTGVMSMTDAIKCMGGNSDYPVQKTLDHLKGCSVDLVRPTRQYVVLVPLDEAHNWFSNYARFKEEYNKFTTDADYRCRVYKYHVLKYGKEIQYPVAWWNQVAFDTFAGPQAVNYYVRYRDGSKLYFEYAIAKDIAPIPFELGYVYFVRRINVLPMETRLPIMKKRDDLSIVTGKVEETGHNSLFLKQSPRSLFLAARNSGWQNRKEQNYGNASMINYLRLHTIQLRGWGDDIGYFERETYQTLNTSLQKKDGSFFEIKVKTMANGNTYVGYETMNESWWAMVVEWNIYGTDGIIWIIDWPLICPPTYCPGGFIKKKEKVVEEKKREIDYFRVWAAACNEAVSSPAAFNRDPIGISRRYSANCHNMALKPQAVFRTWTTKKKV